MILLLLATVVFLWTVVFRIRRRRFYELASEIPAPDCELPIIGIVHKLAGDSEDVMSQLQHFSKEAIKNNGMVKLWFCHLLYIMIVDPQDVEYILKTCLEKDDINRLSRNFIGNGNLFAPVSIWKHRRKVAVPAFIPKLLETYVTIFSKLSGKLLDQVAKCTGDDTTKVLPYFAAYTLDALGESTLGVNLNAQGDSNAPFLVTLTRAMHLVSERYFRLWYQYDSLYKWFPQYKEHQSCLHKLHSFTDEVIKKKREEIKNKEMHVESEPQHEKRNYISFLEQLITLSGGDKGYNDIELREEVLTITMAGTDTTSLAMSFTLMMLAKYPKIQEKVYEELLDVFGESDRPTRKDDLVHLKYLERVLKETMRLFPPVPVITRRVTEEIKLPSGRIMPAGAALVMSIWGAHRDPKYWGPDVDKFDPDRFLPERFDLKYTCSFMPFSQGPRNCIAFQYAYLSMKTALSMFLRRYEVVGEEETTGIPHVRVKLNIMMKDVDNFQVGLRRRAAKK